MKTWPRAVGGLLCLALAGCGDERGAAAGDGEDILVFAAADLQAAFGEMEERFESKTNQGVTIVFGSTGNMASQIANGAPADLFFAANESFLDRLGADGRIDTETRRIYAMGRLAIVWRPEVREPGSVGDLGDGAYGTVAIANPEHAPYGIAGREALRAAGIWEKVEPRLVLGENISQTLQFVQTGNADAAIVALGLVLGPNARSHVVIPESAHTPLRQAAAVIAGSPRAAGATRFLEFVIGPEGQEILARFGFDPPPP